jgi:hypothetical protein
MWLIDCLHMFSSVLGFTASIVVLQNTTESRAKLQQINNDKGYVIEFKTQKGKTYYTIVPL